MKRSTIDPMKNSVIIVSRFIFDAAIITMTAKDIHI